MSKNTGVFVRVVASPADIRVLANELKALTWEHEAEHAVLELGDGRWVIVRGSKMEIELNQAGQNDPFGRPFPSIWVDIDGENERVKRLILHTHPQVTGPSDADLHILELLNQTDSLLFELSGEPDGTIIRPKVRKDV